MAKTIIVGKDGHSVFARRAVDAGIRFSSPEQAQAFIRRRIMSGNQPVLLRAPFNTYTGYGLHACQILEDFASQGHAINLIPYGRSESFSKIPKKFLRAVVKSSKAAWELRLHPPNSSFEEERPFVLFTMWESSKLEPAWVAALNRAIAVIVPCVWNADVFSASGVTSPIRVVPLGINPLSFPYSPVKLSGPCVFGTGGRMAHGGVRKGLVEVAEHFLAAFPNRPDVRLKVKCYPDCPFPDYRDSRIEVTREHLSERKLAEWYSSLTAYVSLSHSGGWELMPHQAMCAGRPVVSVVYGGIAEYFSETCGYVLPYSLTPAKGCYSGHWATAKSESVIEALHAVYRDRQNARIKGLAAHHRAASFTWASSNNKLQQALSDLGLLPPV